MIRALPILLLLTACTDFPQVGHAESELATASTTPTLLTADELVALGASTPDLSNALDAEAAALRARATRLRQR